jgi:hypothetical protein
MTDDNVTQLPVHIDLDLDTAERDPDSVKEPLKINVGGKVITMSDPEDLSWQDIVLLESPTDLLRLTMSPEDRRHFANQKLKAWQFSKLMKSFEEHYDLDEKLREAKRQQAIAGL